MTMMTRNDNKMIMMTRNNNEMTIITKTTRNLQEWQQQYSRPIHRGNKGKSAKYHKNPQHFANVCNILQMSTTFHKSLQLFTKVCKVLQKSTTCCKIFAIYLQASGWDGGHMLLQTLPSKAQHFNVNCAESQSSIKHDDYTSARQMTSK